MILHVRYTAREGGNVLRKPARSNLRDMAAAAGPGQAGLFCLRHEYPHDWYPFILPVDANLPVQTLTLDLPSNDSRAAQPSILSTYKRRRAGT